MFVKEGTVETCINGHIKTLTSGEGCFVDSYRVHSYNGTGVAYVFGGNKKYFKDLTNYLQNLTFSTFFKFTNFEILHKAMWFHEEHNKNTHSLHFLQNGIVQIITSFLLNNIPLVQCVKEKKDNLISDVLRYADSHFAQNLSLTILSEHFNYSKDYLGKIIKKYINLSWNDYINQLRLSKVNYLIKQHKDANILDIAFDCGFNSMSSYYRAKRKYK